MLFTGIVRTVFYGTRDSHQLFDLAGMNKRSRLGGKNFWQKLSDESIEQGDESLMVLVSVYKCKYQVV